METRKEVSSKTQFQFIEENVDIYKLPKVRQSENDTALIGDLHGNGIKFLFFLIREGVLELDADPNQYPENLRNRITGKPEDLYIELVKIYEKEADLESNFVADILNAIDKQSESHLGVNSDTREKYVRANVLNQLQSSDLDFFKAVLNNAKISNQKRLILIGDEFADRGSNDLFIAKIMQKLKKSSVPYEIILSNHGAEFYGAFKNIHDRSPTDEERNKALELTNTRYIYKTSLIHMLDQTLSLQNLGAIIKRNLVDEKEVTEIIDECCTPHLKLLSYVEKDGRLGICSHAPIGFETIKGLAAAFNVSYGDDLEANPVQIKNVIDQINKRFQQALNSGLDLGELLTKGYRITDPKNGRLLDDKLIEERKDSSQEIKEYSAQQIDYMMLAYYMHRTTWNVHRNAVRRPESKTLFWVNGHATPEKSFPTQHLEICLDNQSGKNLSHRVALEDSINKINASYHTFLTLPPKPDQTTRDEIVLVLREAIRNKQTSDTDRLTLRAILKKTFDPIVSLTKDDLDVIYKIMVQKIVNVANEIAEGKVARKDEKGVFKDEGRYSVLLVDEKRLTHTLEASTKAQSSKEEKTSALTSHSIWKTPPGSDTKSEDESPSPKSRP